MAGKFTGSDKKARESLFRPGAMDVKIFLAILIVATILLMANYFAAPL
jgi:hypothetical protein